MFRLFSSPNNLHSWSFTLSSLFFQGLVSVKKRLSKIEWYELWSNRIDSGVVNWLFSNLTEFHDCRHSADVMTLQSPTKHCGQLFPSHFVESLRELWTNSTKWLSVERIKEENRIIVLDDFSTRAVKWIRFMRCDIVELATLDNDAKCRIGKEHIKKVEWRQIHKVSLWNKNEKFHVDS